MIHLHADVIHGLLLLGIVGVLADRWLYGRRTDSLADACKKHGVEWVEPEPVRTLLLRGGRACWEWMGRPDAEGEQPAYWDTATAPQEVVIDEGIDRLEQHAQRPVPFKRVDPAEEAWRARFGLRADVTDSSGS